VVRGDVTGSGLLAGDGGDAVKAAVKGDDDTVVLFGDSSKKGIDE
jgi:hypothetical protein